MALTRRNALHALVAGAGMMACGGASRQRTATLGSAKFVEVLPAVEGRKTIAVFMPDTVQTREVWIGVRDELSTEFNVVPVHMDASAQASTFARAIERHQPSCLVLMNNPTVDVFRHYQQSRPAGVPCPPAVVVLASFLEAHRRELTNTTGISYELPAITTFSKVRSLLKRPVARGGVIHRPAFGSFVREQAALAAREKITVDALEIGADPKAAELKWAIRQLKERVDVIWILNDNGLLTPELIADGWLRELSLGQRVPTIVGVESLVSADYAFGTFAVVPDHVALGSQAAGVVFGVADNQWRLGPTDQVQMPLSIRTIVDLHQTGEGIELVDDALSNIDVVVGARS